MYGRAKRRVAATGSGRSRKRGTQYGANGLPQTVVVASRMRASHASPRRARYPPRLPPATHTPRHPHLNHSTPHHALAKAVYGVTFDPFDDTRLATYSDDADGIVKVWDVRDGSAVRRHDSELNE